MIILVLDKLYFNFYEKIFKGYKVIGGRKRCILVYFGEENRARAGRVHKLLGYVNSYAASFLQNHV